jgi:hypothetical protein
MAQEEPSGQEVTRRGAHPTRPATIGNRSVTTGKLRKNLTYCDHCGKVIGLKRKHPHHFTAECAHRQIEQIYAKRGWRSCSQHVAQLLNRLDYQVERWDGDQHVTSDVEKHVKARLGHHQATSIGYSPTGIVNWETNNKYAERVRSWWTPHRYADAAQYVVDIFAGWYRRTAPHVLMCIERLIEDPEFFEYILGVQALGETRPSDDRIRAALLVPFGWVVDEDGEPRPPRKARMNRAA